MVEPSVAEELGSAVLGHLGECGSRCEISATTRIGSRASRTSSGCPSTSCPQVGVILKGLVGSKPIYGGLSTPRGPACCAAVGSS